MPLSFSAVLTGLALVAAAAIGSAALPGPAPSPAAFALTNQWAVNPGDTGSLAAQSGGLPGTYNGGGPAIDTANTAPVVGGSTASLSFDGTNDYVTVDGSASSVKLTGDMTISFWMWKNSEAGDWQRLVGKGNSTIRNYGVWEEAGNGKRILFQQYDSGGAAVLNLYSTGNIEVNAWYHIACTISGNAATIYINGTASGTATRSGSPGTNDDPLSFGYAAGPPGFHTFFPGRLDDIRIYDNALTSAQVNALIQKSGVVTILGSNGDSSTIPNCNPVSMSAAAPGGTIWYTLNGADPGAWTPSAAAIQYTAPITLPNVATTIRARAYLAGYLPSDMVTRFFDTLLAPIAPTAGTPPNSEPGAYFENYTNTWGDYLPNFDPLTPRQRGGATTMFADDNPIAPVHPDRTADYYGYRWTGWINIPATHSGVWIFYTTSDDGSKLWIGNTQIVDNDGPHGMQERSGQIGLSEGWHPITVVHSEGGGGDGLEVRWDGPGNGPSSIVKALIPASAYRRAVITAQPTITISGGGSTFATSTTVTITGPANSTIYYSLGGASPDPRLFSGGGASPVTFPIDKTTTIRAMATLGPTYNFSPIVGATFTRTNTPPTPISVTSVDPLSVLVVYDMDVNNTNTSNYTISGGITDQSVTSVDARTAQINLSAGTPLLLGTTYNLTISGVQGTNGSTMPSPVVIPFQLTGSGLTRDVFEGIGGTATTDLTNNANYPNNPTSSTIETLFELTGYSNDNYGARMYGYFIPPVTGNYQFALATDDSGKLFLSTNATQAAKVQIANIDGWVPVREYNRDAANPPGPDYPTQQSAPIALTMGTRYFIEALFKEGGGGDNLAVTYALNPVGNYRIPNGQAPTPAVDPGSGKVQLVPYYGRSAVMITQHPSSIIVNVGYTASFTVRVSGGGPYTYQWFKDGLPYGSSIPSNSTTNTLSIPFVSQADYGIYHVVVTGPFNSATSNTATLIPNDTIAPVITAVAPLANLTQVDVIFSELVDSTRAQDVTNYTITGDTFTIVSAVLQPGGRIVRLSLAPGQDFCIGLPYTLTVNPAPISTNDVRDLSVPPNYVLNPNVSINPNPVIFVPTGKPTLSLAGHWRLDEAVGSTTAADSSPSNAPGQVFGDPIFVPAPPLVDTINKGQLNFDGAQGQFIDAAVDPTDGEYSASLWFRTSDPNCGIFAITAGFLGLPTDRQIWLENGDLIADLFDPYVLISNERIQTSGTNYADGQWHHVVHTFGGLQGVQKLYVDGVLVPVTSPDQFPSGVPQQTFSGNNSAGIVRIGWSPMAINAFFSGRLDDVRVYNRAISLAEIQSLADKNWPPDVSAGPNLTVSQGATITLNGTVTDDGRPGSPLTRQWSVFNPPGSPNVVFNDATLEDPQVTFNATGTYVLHLEAGDGVFNACSRTTITVQPPGSLPNVQFVTLASQGAESTSPAAIQVSLSFASGNPVQVTYTTADGTAFAPGDYTTTSGTLIFNPGETLKSINVPVIDDVAVEGDETFLVNLTSASGANLPAVIADRTHTYTIVDNDSPPTVEFTGTASGSGEGIGIALIEVTLSWAYSSDVTVTVTPQDVTTSVNDYGALATTITIPAGFVNAYFQVPIVDDALDEANEVLELTLTPPVPPTGVTVGTNATHALTIVDNDGAPTVSFGSVSSSNLESVTPVSVPVNLSAPSGQIVVVNYAIIGGTAQGGGVDYTHLGTGILTFARGDTQELISFDIVDDLLDENDETISIQLTNANPASFSGSTLHTYTILDNDPMPTVSFTLLNSSGDEATAAPTIEVSLSTVSGRSVTVDYAVSGGTAIPAPGANFDYTLPNGTVTFFPGETSKLITLSVVDDTAFEPAETILISLANPISVTLSAVNTTHTYTITDNDTGASLSINDVTVTETEGAVSAVFTVTISTAPIADVVVGVATAPGTATATADYNPTPSPTQLTFTPAGPLTQQVTITVAGDTLDEINETYFVNLTLVSGPAVISDGQGLGTITDNDATPTLTITSPTQNELNVNNTMTFTVSLSAASGQTVTAQWATGPTGTRPATAGADYTAASGNLTFAPSVTSQDILITILGDTIGEFDETFAVNVNNVVNATPGSLSGTGTIVNDDPTSVTINDVTVTEGNTGTVNAVFTVTVAPPPTAGNPVTVQVFTSDGTATVADNDYVANGVPVPIALTFLDTDPTPGVQTVTVVVNGDTRDEADETFFVNLQNVTGPATIVDSQGQGTITDDDAPPTISINDVTVDESAGTATFLVTLNAVSGQQVTVQAVTANGTATAGADYTAVPLVTLTFIAGDTSENFTVPILQDPLDEAPETFVVNLSTPVNATVADPQGTGTINDDDPTPTFTVSNPTVTEGNSPSTATATFTFTLSAPSGQTVSVPWSTAAGSPAATPGVDYISASGTVTFVPGDQDESVTITVNGDNFDELDEKFVLSLGTPVNATLAGGTQGEATITDDDPTPTLSIADVTQAEGSSGTPTNFSFTVTLSAASNLNVTADVAVTPGTATATTDYNPTPVTGTTVSIPAGFTTGTVTIAVVSDILDEANQTFTVTLSNLVNANPAGSDLTALGTITDDDATPVLSIADNSVAEGDAATTPLVFTVTLTGASEGVVSVNVGTAENGSATAGVDYVAAPSPATLNFPATGAASQTLTVTVTVTGETSNELNETFLVNLSGASANATIGDSQAVGTILNDDGLPQFSVNNPTVTEGTGSPVTLAFTVSLLPAAGISVTVQVATSNGTAVAGADYVAVPTTTLTFAPGETSKIVNVTVIGDSLDEATETLSLILSNPTNATLLTGGDVGTGTIVDDDAAPTLSINDVTVVEGNAGTTNAVFTVTLSAISGQTVTVNVATAAGTASSPADFAAAPSPASLTFAPGETVKTVAVAVVGDTVDEATETFLVNLSGEVNATLADGQGQGTITNDDNPVLTIDNATVAEGVNAVFTITLSAASFEDVTLNWSTADGAVDPAVAPADYVAVATTPLTIPAGTLSTTVTVVVNGDAINENNETFFVNLSSVTNATVGDGQGLGTIIDDDGPPALSINDVTVTEGNAGPVSATFTVSVSPIDAVNAVTVQVTTALGSVNPATPGTDYTAISAPVTVTIPANTPSTTVTVTVTGDTLSEANETFFVNLSNPTNATIADGQGLGTITDDDAPPTVSINDVTVAEGNAGTTNAVFTLTLSTASGQVVSVEASTANGTAAAPGDFTAVSSQVVTFNPGETVKNVAVLVAGDTVDEPTETFFVNLANASSVTILDGQGLGTITNDDDPVITINDVTVTEGDSGTLNATFTVSLSGLSLQDVTVQLATQDQTALVSNNDYVAVPLTTLTIPAGATSAPFVVAVSGDAFAESLETYLVNLSNGANATIGDAQAVGTIIDNDGPPVLTINDVQVTEGNASTVNAVFTITLTPVNPGAAVTVQVSTTAGTGTAGGDYNPTPNPTLVTIPANTPSATVTVAVNGDLIDEPNETFNVVLFNATNATIADSTGVGTILDDDGAPTLSINDVTVVEGNAGTTNAVFTVSLSAVSGQTVTVNMSTAAGTAAAPVDFAAAPSPASLTFAPGETIKNVTVAVAGDTVDEATETFLVNLSGEVNATLADGQGQGTITNDDDPVLTIDNVTVTEGDAGTVNAVFTVTLSGASLENVTFNWATADGTVNPAVASGDYTGVPSTPATIFSPATTLQLTVVVIGDGSNENNETFFVNLTGVTNATVGDGQGLGTIVDDDGPPALSINDVTVTEGNAGPVSATFTVTLLPADTVNTITVQVATALGAVNPATPGADYTAIPTSTLTFAPNVTSQQVTVTVTGDTLSEANETFFVNLSSPVNATIADGQGLGTITDDDAPPTVSINDVTVAEGSATTNAVFTLTLSTASGQPVTVEASTANGTAAAPGDFTAVSAQVVTFNPSETIKTVTVSVVGDTVDEPTETFFVNLANASNVTIADGQGLGTITNDDDPVITINNVTVTETDASTVNAVFVVTLSGLSLQDVTVQVATQDQNATSPADYLAVPLTTLTIAANTLSNSLTVLVAPDNLSESLETYFVNLSAPTNATIGDPQGLGTILDDDGPPSLAIDDVSVTEGGVATFTVSVSGPPPVGSPIVVDLTTSAGTATAGVDYNVAVNPAQLTFTNGGPLTQQVTVQTSGDTLDEANETFFVNLSSASPIADGQGTGTILDDDLPPTLSIGNATVTEGNAGTINAAFTVTLSAASGQTITVEASTANGTAAAPGDFTAVNAQVLTFSPGGPLTQQVLVAVNGDTADEPNETFFVNLANPTVATIAAGQGTGTITNDDDPTITISDPSVVEGIAGQTPLNFTVTLSAASVQDVTVTYSTANGTATAVSDYVAAAGATLTIVAGQLTGTIAVLVNGDTTGEPTETLFVNLSAPVNATIADNQGTGTITNDDLPSLSINSVTVVEGNAAVFTVTVGGTAFVDVTVNYATADGTANAGTDYGAASGTLTIPAGQPSGTITVPTTADTTDELNETFTLTLSGAVNANIAGGTGTGTITDDDGPTISVGNVTQLETAGSTTFSFPVTLSGTSVQAVSFTWATSNGTASAGSDYGNVPATLVTIPAGSTNATLNVTVLGNTVDEPDETFFVTLSNVVNATVAAGQGTGTILNDDDLAFSAAALPAGTDGANYSYTFSATGGVRPYVWSLEGGSSPPFPFNLNPNTGTISGIAPIDADAVATIYSFTMRVTDSQAISESVTQSFTITINEPAATVLAVNNITPAAGTVGVAYSHFFSATGGAPPYTLWAVTALPAGLTFNTSTGEISGTPTASGSTSLTATVTDSLSATDSQAGLVLTISQSPVTITTNLLADGAEGSFYSQTIDATGGLGAFTWSLIGALPTGLNLNTAATGRTTSISGTPAAATAGAYTFTVQISDGGQTPAVVDTQTYTITIAAAGAPLAVTTTSLPPGTAGDPWSGQLTASGGTPAYTWAVSSLPAGVTLDTATGVLSGSAAAGVYGLTVTVTDSLGATASSSVTLNIAPPPVISATSNPEVLPDGFDGQSYSEQVVATGGVGPLTYALTFGGAGESNPAGLTLSTTSGLLGGTPVAGSYLFTVTVTDANGVSDSQQFSLNVIPVPAAGTMVVTTTQLPPAQVGVPYSVQLQVVGGTGVTPPYTWIQTGGTLPAGLALSSNGVISGTPTQSGTFGGLTFSVSDAGGPPALTANSGAMILEVIGTLVIVTTSLPDGGLAVPYTAQLISSGASGGETWSLLSGSLPAGLSLNPATGAIGGAPTVAGLYGFTAQVADGLGRTAQRALSINILAVLVIIPDGSTGKSCSIGSVADGGAGVPWPALLAAALALLAIRRRY